MMIVDTHLIPGEKFTFEDQPETPQTFLSDYEINQKYKKGEIRIVTEQARYPLNTIETMLDSKNYKLNPEYQRRKRWNNKKKSRLIESFIMNIPIPPIFLYESEYSVYEVMDGQQRLTTIYDFYQGKFNLEGLEYWKELNGRNYKNLPEQAQQGIDRRYLSSIILLRETAKSEEQAESLKKIVFERLNTGGEKLTAQETRNALLNGKFNELCKTLGQNELFRKMWQLPLEREGEEELLKSESYRKMEDVELVLRFFAYRHIDKLKNALSLDKFLDEYLKQANNYPDETIKDLENLFNQTIDLIYYILEEAAFIPPPNPNGRKSYSPLKIVYDSMMQAFSRNIKYQESFRKNKQQIKNNLYQDTESLINKEDKNRFLFEGRYTTKKGIENRIKYFNNFLKDYIS